MKKIGITCYPTVGGSGIIATELGKRLANLGYEVHFISTSLPFRLDTIHPKIYFHEVEVSHYPVFQYPPYDLALANKMADVIDREKLDVLHVHYALPHAICAILARNIASHKVKVVTTLHGTDISVLGVDPTLKKMIEYGINESDGVTAVSNSLAKQTYDMLQVNKDIQVIYNFINEDEYYRKELPHIRKQYNIREEEHVFIHISNFRKVKRIDDVVRTFNLIQKEIPAKLLLVGDGPEKPYIHNLVSDLGIQGSVLFLGRQKNISDLLSISDVKLLFSEKESFGLVLLEAMSCGVPCIGTNIGGIPEVIEHEKNGYLVDIGEHEAAAKFAIRLVTDRYIYDKVSQYAIQTARDKFCSEKIISEYINVYKNVLKS
mgnify:CR=1 FL=1